MPSFSYLRTCLNGIVLAAVVGGGLILWSQESSPQLSPRELFYREQAPAHGQRAATGTAKSQAADQTNTPVQKVASAPGASATAAEGSVKNATLAPVETSTTTKANPEVSHLGLRYSLLLVDTNSGAAQAVNSTQVFDQGQCFGLEFESNRSGYLYVFNLGSSGAWKPLLPTAEMPEEGNFVPAFTTMRVPSSHCFRVTSPPGGEHLFVVLSRNPQDVDELNRSIRSEHGGQPDQPHPAEAGGDLTAIAANLTQAVQKLAGLKGRDLEVEEVGGTKNGAEPTPAVYVVHTSATPSDKVVTEIQINHR